MRARQSRSIPAVLAIVGCMAPAMAAEPVLREGDRVVFVGDSITGQSAGPNGYVGIMKEALAKVHLETKTTLIPLGGSGQTVGGWANIEKRSREKSVTLDVPNVDVKATLDAGGEVVVIMLGMNNVLRPDMDNAPEAVAKWTKTYHELIVALRERAHPRIIALATPTMCTEDEASLRNQLMDAMSQSLAQLAASDQCLLLPVREHFKKMLREGRTYRPDFHLTGDFVHPNPAGHLAIATAMLEGLGEAAAAQAIYDARAPQIWQTAAGKLPTLSYAVTPTTPDTTLTDVQAFKIRYWFTSAVPRSDKADAKVTLKAPEGWTVTPAVLEGGTGEFTASGPLDRLQNVLTLATEPGALTTSISIPTPWLVGTGNAGGKGWTNKAGFVFNPDEGRMPFDAELIQGRGFGAPITEGKWSRPFAWHRYIASVNYTGGNDPGSVDFSANAWLSTFEVGYGARWIYSPATRTVPVNIGSHAFAGTNFLSMWFNGDKVWESAKRNSTAELKMRKGWNTWVIKSNHLEWQWQHDLQLAPTSDENLSDLRFSIVPKDFARKPNE